MTALRLGQTVLAKVKSKAHKGPPVIVSGTLTRFAGGGMAMLALENNSNPQPATVADREMLEANRTSFRNGKRLALLDDPDGGVAFLVEVILVKLSQIKPLDPIERTSIHEVRNLMDQGDEDTLVLADALMARGLLAVSSPFGAQPNGATPTGGSPWTQGDLYTLAYCRSMMTPPSVSVPMNEEGEDQEPAPVSMEGVWNLEDCFEDLEDEDLEW